MTNELEKQFFDTFGIEPEIFTGCKLEKNNWKEDTCPFEKDGIMELCHKVCKYAFTEREIYHTITDTHYLKLICILNKFDTSFDYYYQEEYQVLRETILEDCLGMVCKLKQETFEKLKHQVRTLFEEGNNEM